ncbi:MAG: 30S ribosomal protein S1 [Candidatus Omnitrophica bacterium]|nr:30S ribosomal protein S1 [Candidatus Omnitrophota bacterium]
MTQQNKESLDELYKESIRIIKENEIIKGKIVKIRQKEVFVDVGFKAEGIVPISEFLPEELKEGNVVELMVDSIEDDSGMIVLSRQKARRIKSWDKILNIYQNSQLLAATVTHKVKGGFMVNAEGIEGFLPLSQSGFKGIPEDRIIGKEFKFKILKLNNLRHSIIVSRKEAIQREKEETKEKLFSNLETGKIITGRVKAITDYGAFIDLGGIDGLLHIADMSWSKINHPSELLAVGDNIEVMILSIDKEQNKISLGLKQRFPDPWKEIENKYSVGSRVKGKIVNILNYGIFVELEKGVEGLVHVSEISWTKRVDNPKEMFAIGDNIEAQVISIDKESRKIALSIKQLEINPWLEAESRYPIGSKVKGIVRGFTFYGAFVELESNLEGMIHISDMSWTKRVGSPQDVLKKGQKVEVVVLSVDTRNRRISLGLKQTQPNPWPEIAKKYPLNTILETEVVNITDFGVFVKLDEEIEGLIYLEEIDKEILNKLKPADKIKAKVIKIDIEEGKIGLSAKTEEVK